MAPGTLRPWTEAEDARIAELLAEGLRLREVAAELGRSYEAVRSRSFRCGLVTRQRFTAEEDAYLREHYGQRTAREIARHLKRRVRGIHGRAVKLGLSKPSPRWDRALDAQLRALNAAGDSDTEIGRKLGWERHTIQRHRRRLGLPDMARGPQFRRAIAAGTKRQLDRMGISSLAQLRLSTWRRMAIDRGWPDVVNGRPVCHRHVQILDALWTHGPATRRQLAERIGVPWKGPKKTLTSNGEGGSYLAELMRAGLVVNLGRCVGGNGRGRNVCLYALDVSVEKSDGKGASERGQ
jgi:DNA-binding CsgD family transcriptional regulator